MRKRQTIFLDRTRVDHRTQSQGHHTIDRLEGRGAERESARLSSLMGREIIVGHKAKDITTSIAWRIEVQKEKALDYLP